MRELEKMAETASAAPGGAGPLRMSGADKGVKIEAQFKVGEYDIVILSASDSMGLDTWLRQNKYTIPDGAEPILRPYVQAGMKFFVAKVDAAKVQFDSKGMAKLSPLRFHYDTDTFSLPVRLGLLNSGGTQDLIVHILARGQRYEVANYRNVTIPTNLDVSDGVRTQFGAFYAALFDRTLEENPGAVITEYAWGASSCDPCPTSPLAPADFATLGGDALPTPMSEEDSWKPERQFVLTRLHARYRKDTLGEDLVFRTAKPIVGGREFPGPDGKLETGARADSLSNFQGRYAIRHAWTGPIDCSDPKRGVWGGPPGGHGAAAPEAAQDLAFAPRGAVQLASLVRHDVPEIKLKVPSAAIPHAGELPKGAQAPGAKGGCGACAAGAGAGAGEAAAALAALALAFSARRRRETRTP
jgi:MYXO-CTERM domain-containing protein